MTRKLPEGTDQYLMELLGHFSDEIILSPETADCIRRSLARWRKETSREGRPSTVDEIAIITNPCLCPPYSVNQAVMAYLEVMEHYKWIPRQMRGHTKGDN